MSDLKPCPFCGSKAQVKEREEPNGDIYAVTECVECYAEMPIAVSWMEEVNDYLPKSIAAWNRRADLPPTAPTPSLDDFAVAELEWAADKILRKCATTQKELDSQICAAAAIAAIIKTAGDF
jgi:Lar family restriction alleviation protein